MEFILRFADEWAKDPLSGEDPQEWIEEWTLENEYSAHDLLECFSFSAPSDDETILTFSVRCTTNSSKDCRILLNAFGLIINERCKTKVLNDAYEVEIIRAGANGAKIAPNPMNKALLGAMIGAALPYAIFFVLNLIDTRVKTEEDIKSRFEYPILGQIPRL